jgi:hypothetical protein
MFRFAGGVQTGIYRQITHAVNILPVEGFGDAAMIHAPKIIFSNMFRPAPYTDKYLRIYL